MLHGDFLKPQTRKSIKKALQGLPHMILGTCMFVGNSSVEHQADIGFWDLSNNEYTEIFLDKNRSVELKKRRTLHDALTRAAWDFLAPGGFLFVLNGAMILDQQEEGVMGAYFADEFLPPFLQQREVAYLYEDTLTRVYQKKLDASPASSL